MDSKKRSRIQQDVTKEKYEHIFAYVAQDWNQYGQTTTKQSISQTKREEYEYSESRRGVWRGNWIQVSPFQHETATGFAVKKAYFGEGAERIVYHMTELSPDGTPVGVPLVAKESKYLLMENDDKQEDAERSHFHETFIRTQMKASNWAKKFNTRLDNAGVSPMVPRIYFLQCSVYICEYFQPDGRFIEKAYLSEHQLDNRKYKKWNDNVGGVDGNAVLNICQSNPLDTESASLFCDIFVGELATIEEGDDDDDEEEDGEDEEDEENEIATSSPRCPAVQPSASTLMYESRMLDADVPQAFTHFTYTVSRRKDMVCDLQGVLDNSKDHPRFLFTDPCIHHQNNHPTGRGGRRTKGKHYGRTDMGYKGMHDFFNTHQCNALCDLLGISRIRSRDVSLLE